MKCFNCPRKCGVDREIKSGFCGASEKLKVALAKLFFYEEPIVTGNGGSGTIFFSGCNLKCCFCQNYHISHENFGKEISVNRLAEIFKELEEKGAENINLVSPTQYSEQIISALKIYTPKIPIIYNCNGYENFENLSKLFPFVDVFLVDLKFFAESLSKKYCLAENYFEIASKVITQMIKNKPLKIENGMIKQGVIVRHLVMPNCTKDSLKILDFLIPFKDQIVLSLMSQYTPTFNASLFPEINRKITPLEYKLVLKHAEKINFPVGFTQDLESGTSKYIPNFNLEGV